MDTSWESNMTGKLLLLLIRQYKSSVPPVSFVFYSVTETARKSSFQSPLFILGCQIYLRHDISTISFTVNYCSILFLGTIAKLRTATINFILSVRPSVCMKPLGSH